VSQPTRAKLFGEPDFLNPTRQFWWVKRASPPGLARFDGSTSIHPHSITFYITQENNKIEKFKA